MSQQEELFQRAQEQTDHKELATILKEWEGMYVCQSDMEQGCPQQRESTNLISQ